MEMTPSLWDPPVSEHTEKRAPDSWGPLVSWKRLVRHPWKDPPPVERGTKPGVGRCRA
jgi:hypothetical protein